MTRISKVTLKEDALDVRVRRQPVCKDWVWVHAVFEVKRGWRDGNQTWLRIR